MSIFGTLAFNGTGGFNGGSQDSGSLDVPAGALIVACAANSGGGSGAFDDAVISDSADNDFVQLDFQSTNSGDDGAVWAYSIGADADTSDVVAATYTGGGGSGFQALGVWVIPIIGGGTAAFDVEALIAALSGAGPQSSGAMATTGLDEIAFGLLFDRDASTPYSAVSPAILDNGQFAATRAAAEHITYSSPQAGAILQMLGNGGSGIGSFSAISFKSPTIAKTYRRHRSK
jgi:hypothetical protein